MLSKRKLAISLTSFIIAAALFCRPSMKSPASGFAESATEGFTIRAIAAAFPKDLRWTSSCDMDLEGILSQKFTYFAKGAQCFAFISEDSQYVLKFFKQRKFLKIKTV